MPDKKGNLYLYEAIELRNEFDRHVELLEGFLANLQKNARSFMPMMMTENRLRTSTRKRSKAGSRNCRPEGSNSIRRFKR